MADGELFSQRHGRARVLDRADFAELVWNRIRELSADGHFERAMGSGFAPGLITEDDFLRRLGKADVYERVKDCAEKSYLMAPSSCRLDPDVLFDTLEFLHAEVVSEEVQPMFREKINPDLALFDPPMEMLSNGQISERAPGELRPLLDEPIPDDAPAPLRDPLRAAIAQFRERGASDHDKRSALKHLADVLEPLRNEIDEYLLPADERALFQIANKFWLRHNDRKQMRSYYGVWLDWIFYVYVATAHSLLAVLDRQTLSDRVFGEEPNAEGGLPI